MYDKFRKTFFPILAAIIWGGGYIFQEINTAGTFTITAMRSTVAFPFLMLVILGFNKGKAKNLLSEKEIKDAIVKTEHIECCHCCNSCHNPTNYRTVCKACCDNLILRTETREEWNTCDCKT